MFNNKKFRTPILSLVLCVTISLIFMGCSSLSNKNINPINLPQKIILANEQAEEVQPINNEENL